MNALLRPADLQADRRRDFQDQVVCKVLRGGRVIGQIRHFREEQRALTGSPQLTLKWLRRRFPDFPVRLGAVMFTAQTPAWPDFFHRFTQTPCFQAYQRWRRRRHINDRRETVGLVFNMAGVTFVLHNCPDALRKPAKRVVRKLGTPPVTFVFEELSSLLNGIGTAWAKTPAAPEKEDE